MRLQAHKVLSLPSPSFLSLSFTSSSFLSSISFLLPFLLSSSFHFFFFSFISLHFFSSATELLRSSIFVSFRPTQPWRNLVVPLLREALAITAMYIIMVISQFAKIYGNVAFIMVVAVGAQPRQQSVGKALRSSVLNISAVLFSTAYALLVGVILHKIDPGGAANTAISRWAALTVHMLFTTMLRARFPDMIVAHCISSITVTLLLFSSVTTGLPLALTIAISEPLISVFASGSSSSLAL